jgi:hypothetical protein
MQFIGTGWCGAAKRPNLEAVPPEMWNFHIEGYHVCEKCLANRRGLTFDVFSSLEVCLTRSYPNRVKEPSPNLYGSPGHLRTEA